jgi:regulator of sigma E protease
MSFLQPLLSFILALSLLVLVHEFGHFWVARRSGVRVLRFSVGFGPELAGITRGDTRYSLCAIPFGGYVKFAGDNPEEVRDETSDEFLSQSLGTRSAIVLAGPVMNYVLAILLFAVVLKVGGMETIGTTRIGSVEKGSLAETIDIRTDDVIRSVDGVPVADWMEFGRELVRVDGGTEFALSVERGGQTVTVRGTAPTEGGFATQPLGISPFTEPRIGGVQSDGPAAAAGLQAGDRILEVAGTPVDRWSRLAEIIRENPGQAVEIAWDRDGDRLQATVTPRGVPSGTAPGDTVGQIGILQEVETRPIGYGAALVGGWERTWWITEQVIKLLPQIPKMIFRSIFHGDENTTLGGPVRMAQMFGEAARLGALTFLAMMASISTQLAVFNLMPIPVLDGGHLALYLVEFVTRRPPSLRVKIALQQIGFALLLLLMLSVTVMDVGRFFG